MTSLLSRFEPRPALVAALKRQEILAGAPDAIIDALVDHGKLEEFSPGQDLIRQNDGSTDAYFLLLGEVELHVHGNQFPYKRLHNQVVGEFAAINTALVRTATVRAAKPTVALKVSSQALIAAADQAEGIWRLLAISLTAKIEQRNQLINSSNDRPTIFLIATKEHSDIANTLHVALATDFDVRPWSDDDLFPPGSYQLQELHRNAFSADFGIILTHPGDLTRASQRSGEPAGETLLFELGYLMSLLGRQRTVLMIPDTTPDELRRDFKGLQPLCYGLPTEGEPLRVALAPAIDKLRDCFSKLKVRSKLRLATDSLTEEHA